MSLDRRGQSRPRIDDGASAVEYGLILAAISVAIIIGMFSFGISTAELFGGSVTCIQSHGADC